jgi:hypothetical protein
MKKIFKYIVICTLLFGLIGIGVKFSGPSIVNHDLSYTKNYTIQEATDAASNIVIGKIISNSKDTYDSVGNAYPKTDSVIHIEKNIKGNLSGDIIFSQEGGLDKKTNKIHIMGGYKILTPGQQYLFFINKYSNDSPPGYLQENPILEGKYYSIGGAPQVYRVEGKMAKNVVMPERDRELSNIEQQVLKK